MRLRTTTTLSNYTLLRSMAMIFAFCFLLPTNIQAQCTGAVIFTEDFEDNGNTANGGASRYSSPADFRDSGNDFWGRIRGADENYFLTNTSSGSTINSANTYSGWNGAFYYAGEDLDDTGASALGAPDGNDEKNIQFTGINITGQMSLCVSMLVAAGDNAGGCGASRYDAADFIQVFYDVDGAGEVLGMCFNYEAQCQGDAFNEPLRHDNAGSTGGACSGDGTGGTLLTAAFQQFTFNIPVTGNSLDLRINVHMDAGSEEIAIDFVRVHAASLPIELTSFNAVKQDEAVKLTWTTETETNNEYFQIERSLDGTNYTTIGKVDGAGTTEQASYYEFMHTAPTYGINYYRLKQIDFDGAFAYSDVQSVDFTGKGLTIATNPNPFSGNIELKLSKKLDRNTAFEIYDMMGRMVHSGIFVKDQLNLELDLSHLKSGVFMVHVSEGENAVTQKIVKF